MTLRHFRVFTAVCDTMNMTAAAEQLYISQSAVSQAIAELEKHYNVHLFERMSKKLYLTAAGQKLLGYARHILRMNEDVEHDMQALQENGVLRVGASVTVAAHVLPQIAVLLRQVYPKTELTVMENNTAKIEEMILKDEVDLGVVEGDASSAELISRPFMEDELVFICAPTHSLASCVKIEPKQLERESFIMREKGSGTRKTVEQQLELHRISYQSHWTCNNAETIKMAVAAGLGVSVLSQRSVTKEVKAGLLCQKEILGISFRRDFKLIYHRNKFLTVPLQHFINLCLNFSDNLQA